MQIGDPSAISKDKHISFFLKARRFGSFEHLPLVKDFQGVNAIGFPHLDHTDFAEGTTADDFEDFKVILAQPQFLDSHGHGFHWKKKKKIITCCKQIIAKFLA